MAKPYPKVKSTVRVVYIDGEVCDYALTAGPGIARYLAQDAAATGMLTIMSDSDSTCVPVSHIRSFQIIKPVVESTSESEDSQ